MLWNRHPLANPMTDTLTYRGKQYFRHALSQVFPVANNEEFALLKSSIKEVGLLEPILIARDSDTMVIDGWNRLRACQEDNLEATFKTVDADADLYSVTIALNIARRHLTASQKALIAGQLAQVSVGRHYSLATSNNPGSYRPNLDDKNQGESRPHFDGFEPGSSADESPGVTPPVLTLAQTSEMLGISRSTAAKGKAIANSGNPELIESVKSGAFSLDEAQVLAKQTRGQQADEIRTRLAAGKAGFKELRKGIPLAQKVAKLLKKAKPLPEDVTLEQAQLAAALIGGELHELILVVRNLDRPGRTLLTTKTLDLVLDPLRDLLGVLERARSSSV